MDDGPDDLPPFDLGTFLPYRLAVAAKRSSEDLARLYRDRFGLTVPEWRVLAHLAGAGPDISVRDVEAGIQLERYEVSRTAARLAAKGLLEKTASPADRRLVVLRLTPAGRALLAELLPLAQAYQARIEARLGAAGYQGLDAALRALEAEED
ncbi:MarR family winged helix-turn-helix transcriptional regulator [Wenxinia saemankumensis]|uniref:DNA-binding transcriptional regulator, MarR family n=1 Tax=Wenxinia saemankumensis TaxID=1447782 RepID=A0A1M6ACR7_9RHOB|nr:MarR family winged helix-turn-helix transcriptional regulator [Wenxinia saemankumensis]SHI34209.1 DNA-binding transcriptional regulator, MarR family [Wenxinia saemankumensis]